MNLAPPPAFLTGDAVAAALCPARHKRAGRPEPMPDFYRLSPQLDGPPIENDGWSSEARRGSRALLAALRGETPPAPEPPPPPPPARPAPRFALQPGHFAPPPAATPGPLRIAALRDALAAAAAAAFGCEPVDLVSARRDRPAVLARWATQAALERAAPQLSTTQLGRLLGGRDHTTILHARARIAALRDESPDFAEACERLDAVARQLLAPTQGDRP